MKKFEIKKYLIEKYNPIGIVLFGSRVRKNVHNKTDWDLFVFTNKTEQDVEDFAELREWNGELLEVTPISVEEMKKEDFILDTAMHPLKEFEVLYDNSNGEIEKNCKKTKEAREKGPQALSERQKNLAFKILTKYIRKVESRGDQPEIVYFAASQFFVYAIRYWFQFRELWPEPIYKALSIIKQDDPEYEILLKKLFTTENSNSEEILGAMKELQKKLLTIDSND